MRFAGCHPRTAAADWAGGYSPPSSQPSSASILGDRRGQTVRVVPSMTAALAWPKALPAPERGYEAVPRGVRRDDELSVGGPPVAPKDSLVHRRLRKSGGPGRTRTSNQAVMSAPTASKNPRKIGTCEHNRMRLLPFGSGIPLVIHWFERGRRAFSIRRYHRSATAFPYNTQICDTASDRALRG